MENNLLDSQSQLYQNLRPEVISGFKKVKLALLVNFILQYTLGAAISITIILYAFRVSPNMYLWVFANITYAILFTGAWFKIHTFGQTQNIEQLQGFSDRMSLFFKINNIMVILSVITTLLPLSIEFWSNMK
jgi:hypothetical protein